MRSRIPPALSAVLFLASRPARALRALAQESNYRAASQHGVREQINDRDGRIFVEVTDTMAAHADWCVHSSFQSNCDAAIPRARPAGRSIRLVPQGEK